MNLIVPMIINSAFVVIKLCQFLLLFFVCFPSREMYRKYSFKSNQQETNCNGSIRNETTVRVVSALGRFGQFLGLVVSAQMSRFGPGSFRP